MVERLTLPTWVSSTVIDPALAIRQTTGRLEKPVADDSAM